MEGLAIALDPQLDLIRAALPYIAKSKAAESMKGLREATAFQMTFSGRDGKGGDGQSNWDESAAKRADGMEEERIAKEKSATEFAAQARQAAEANAGWNK